jgi:hypothetical protein
VAGFLRAAPPRFVPSTRTSLSGAMHAAFAGSMGGMPGPFGPSGPMPMGPQPGFRGPFGAFEKPFPVVRLRGLPFNAGELDIFEFFQARGGALHTSGVCVVRPNWVRFFRAACRNFARRNAAAAPAGAAATPRRARQLPVARPMRGATGAAACCCAPGCCSRLAPGSMTTAGPRCVLPRLTPLSARSLPQGLDPVDVLLVRREGRNTGEAYVLFGTAMQARAPLRARVRARKQPTMQPSACVAHSAPTPPLRPTRTHHPR